MVVVLKRDGEKRKKIFLLFPELVQKEEEEEEEERKVFSLCIIGRMGGLFCTFSYPFLPPPSSSFMGNKKFSPSSLPRQQRK